MLEGGNGKWQYKKEILQKSELRKEHAETVVNHKKIGRVNELRIKPSSKENVELG